MATIIIKNSTGSGAVPSSLTQGELAINVVDGKLFYGSGSGNIVKEFTGSGGGSAISASYALTASYASNGGVTQLLAGPNITLSPTNGLGQVTVSATLSGSTSFNTATGSYGSFYDTTTQTNPVGNVPRSMSFNSTDITNGVSISGSTNPFNTYIKTTNAGVYDIQFSAQLDKTDFGTDEIVIWLRKNGIDLTDTATSVTLAGNNAKNVAAWNWFVSSAAGDYYQVIWYSPDTNVRLFAEVAGGGHPGVPSVILTVNRVDQFLSNTGSFSGSFNGLFTGSLFGTASWATNALTASFINTASTNAFVQNGNSFGTTAILGTNDNQSLAFETNGSTKMFISSSGNVGINTTTPGYALEIANTGLYYAGASSAAQLLITTSGSVNKEGSFIAAGAGSNRTLQLGILDNSQVPVGIDMFETNDTFGSTYLNFKVNNANLVRMTGSFVGIGTTTPAYTLDVSGSTRITNNLTVTGSTILNNGQTTIRGAGATSATTTLIVQNSTPTNIITVLDNGTVGILRAPTTSLDIAGTTRISGSFNTAISGAIFTVIGSGSTQPIFTVQGSQGELFSINDSLSGSLFSVNDISGLPILEVFSDSTTLIGDYQDPMLITTKKVTMTNSGSFVVYSLPTASYDTAFFDYSIKSGSNARAGQIMAIQSGSSVNFTETTTTDFGSTTAVSFTVLVSGSNMVLTGSAATGSWTIKSIIRGI